MYWVVTGAAGFIGSNLVKALNRRGERHIIAVDHLKNAAKFRNLVGCDLAHYVDKTTFMAHLSHGDLDGELKGILHQGACSDTLADDGCYMMENNYQYSIDLLDYCQAEAIPLIYASSAAVYGNKKQFREQSGDEDPRNIYGYSKYLFDQIVRQRLAEMNSQVVGLRYFNVYGPGEAHKGAMASIAYQLYKQYGAHGYVNLFAACQHYADGEQRRDFVFVDDVVEVNLYFLEHPQQSGIFNVGSGHAHSFNDVACALINQCQRLRDDQANKSSLSALQHEQHIRYIPFPQNLQSSYQAFTQADLTQLRQAGYGQPFLTLEHGIAHYVNYLHQQSS